MRRLRAWLSRLIDVGRVARHDRDLAHELDGHLQLHVDEQVRDGVAPEEARRRAILALGGLEPTKERYRDRRGLPIVNQTIQDLRYGARVFRRSPGFTITAVLTLAIGIGFNTAVFSLVNAAMLAPLPVSNSRELVWIYAPQAFPYEEFHLPFAVERNLFAGVASVRRDETTFRNGVDIEQVQGEGISGNYFEVLGVAPHVGRALSAGDDLPSAEPVVVISDSLWRRRFNADPAIIGQAVDLRWSDFSRAYFVVGVMPPGFGGALSPWEPAEYWVSHIRRREDVQAATSRFFRGISPGSMNNTLIGRRQQGVTVEQVQSFANLWGHSVRAKLSRNVDPAVTVRESRVVRLPFDPQARVPPAWMAAGIMVVAGFVLVIGVGNLASLMLARGVVRRREVAVRVTLGAGRWRLLRQLTTEGLLLGVAGGAAGLVVAAWLISMGLIGLPAGFSVTWSAQAASIGVPLHWRVLLFTAVTALAAGVFVGLAPVRQAWRTNLLEALATGAGAASRPGRSRIRYWAVVPQVSLALALLIAAGVAVVELTKVAFWSSGYETEQAVFVEPGLPGHAAILLSMTREERAAFYRRLVDRARDSPAIASVALTDRSPVRHVYSTGSLTSKEGFAAGVSYRTDILSVTPAYFEILGIPLLFGRSFDGRDTENALRVGIIDTDLAASLWPDQNPIGRHVTWPAGGLTPSSRPSEWVEIVGVVGGVRAPLSEGATAPTLYTPHAQGGLPGMLIARARGSQGNAIQALKEAVGAADPRFGVVKSGTLADEVNRLRHPRRLAAALLGFSGVVGLVLACLGVYGVVSYSVAERVQELGIRVALGADRGDLVRLVLREGALTAVAGTVLGLVLAFSVTRIAASLVVNMPATNPLVFLVAPALLSAMVLLACYVSARRAARVDPIAVLKMT